MPGEFVIRSHKETRQHHDCPQLDGRGEGCSCDCSTLAAFRNDFRFRRFREKKNDECGCRQMTTKHPESRTFESSRVRSSSVPLSLDAAINRVFKALKKNAKKWSNEPRSYSRPPAIAGSVRKEPLGQSKDECMPTTVPRKSLNGIISSIVLMSVYGGRVVTLSGLKLNHHLW